MNKYNFFYNGYRIFNRIYFFKIKVFFSGNVNCFFKIIFARRKHFHEFALDGILHLQKCAQTKL